MNWFSKLFRSPPAAPKEEPEPGCLVYCVPQSIACAWAWSVNKKLPVQIAVSKIKPNTDHAQAETLYGNKWRPLIMDWTDKGPVVLIGNRHFDVEPYRYLTLQEWIHEQIKYTAE